MPQPRRGGDGPYPHARDHGGCRARNRVPPARDCTGNFFIDDEVLTQEGVTDLGRHSSVAGSEPIADLYVEALV